jgi:hypothetical protein
VVHTAAVAVAAVPVEEVRPEDCRPGRQAPMQGEQKVGHRSDSCKTDWGAAEVDTAEGMK